MGQQRQLTPQQMWDNSVRITDYTYQVTKWDGDLVYFTGSNPTGRERIFVQVDTKSGKSEVISEIPFAQSSLVANIKVDGLNPTYSPDSSYIAFTRDNDLYTLRLSDNKETRLTTDGSDVILNGYASWVYMEEILGRPSAYRAFWWSPDSKWIAFLRADDREVPLFTITDSPEQNGYVETVRYPKAGNPIPKVKTGIVSPEGGQVIWAKVGDNQEFYFALPYWRPDSKALWLQWSNRNQNHYKILETDIATGDVKQIYEEQQEAWIDIDHEPRIRFLESGKGFILTSDKSGWEHLYLHDMNGKLINPITQGNYTVLNVLRIDEKEKSVYFTCYKDNIGCEDFYKVSFDGKKLQRLSFGDYTHRITLSPNGKYFVTTYSNVATPPKVALYTTMGKFVCQVQDTKNEHFEMYERPNVEFITIKSKDNKFDLPMRIIMPLNKEPEKVYPVALSVYGGPGSISVRGGWADVFGGIPHQYAQEGLIQVTVDHRGSGHNGKIGQTTMYRNLGYWEIEDYTRCVEWLVENRQANPQIILIYGFSYGGYITSYALTYGADTFTHGIAGGSVTDWMLYDATYSERFMDTPQENPNGYAKSAVLPYAEKLQGKLLLTHGLRDENVHIQNTWQLVNLLQEHNKEFELMIYPESRHGYRGKKSIHSRVNDIRFIYKHLLDKTLPTELLNAFEPRR
ncbi:MAG: S9 family peptidase [Prevotellaceae bacterium]|nr:S9 family peptidase [Prevotellaceae bacterium]